MTGKIERAITRAVSEMKRRGMKVAVYATDVVSDVYGNARPTRGQLLRRAARDAVFCSKTSSLCLGRRPRPVAPQHHHDGRGSFGGGNMGYAGRT